MFVNWHCMIDKVIYRARDETNIDNHIRHSCYIFLFLELNEKIKRPSHFTREKVKKPTPPII